MGEEVDLEGDLVAVLGDGVTLGRRDARVVHEDVEVRALGNDTARQGLDLVEVREVGGVRAQSARVDADRGDQTVGGGARLLGGTAVQQHRGTAFGELPGGLVADA